MDTTVAGKIRSKQALKGLLPGLATAYFIMMWFSQGLGFLYALLWFKINLLVGVIATLLAAHFFGQRAGVGIVIKYKNKFWTGVQYVFLTVLGTIVTANLVGIFQNIGVDDKVFFNYSVKPLFWGSILWTYTNNCCWTFVLQLNSETSKQDLTAATVCL